MTQSQAAPTRDRKRSWPWMLAFWVFCLALNLLLSKIPSLLNVPLYLDSVGTILAAATGGFVPGILVGYITNLLNGLSDSVSVFYGVCSVLIAVAATFLARKDAFRSLPKAVLAVFLFALAGGALGSVLTWVFNGFKSIDPGAVTLFLRERLVPDPFLSQILGDFTVDLLDKAISVALAALILRMVPYRLLEALRFRLWQQQPLSREERLAARYYRSRRMSLRPKFVILIALAMVIISLVTTGICFSMFRQTLFDTQTEMAYGVTNVLISAMDPDRVDEYLTLGDAAPGYAETEAAMASIRASSEEISYVYVYQIREDGCHVVFDPDTPDTPGADPGSVIPFDEAFLPYVPKLLAGERIGPIISDESYGWLLSVYQPVFDSGGHCVCYACADISMMKLARDQNVFLVKVLSLFISFSLLIVFILLRLADYGIILPINSMSLVSSRFAFNTEARRTESIEQLRSLGIHTGDEIENLYHAIAKTTEDSVRYIAESQQKNETIARMQENLISVLADMVESRDQFTGNHIKNTAAYVRIIMEELRAEGLFTDQLTDDFILNVVHSAPLHDIGKIRISDTILNKPGKLTDGEFEQMKLHTVYGRDIIRQAMKASSDVSYLDEAENLAAYHHEKWNGRGYPSGLSGEDIPLSARIMAVADVFDALVSKRSYKEPFPFEQAMDIIRDGSGSHFDPRVAGAFLRAEDRVRQVLSQNRGEDEPEEDAPAPEK